MRARCFRCQNTFETERFGVQTCPSCGQEVFLPDPGAPAPDAGAPAPSAPGDAPPPSAPPPAAPPGAAGWGTPPAGWGAPPPGWGAPPGWPPPPPPGWAPVAPGAQPPVAEQSAPFAEREKRGLFSSFLETWRLAAVEPTRFFRQVRVSETRTALLFGAIALTLGNWVALAFSYATASATAGFVAQFTRRMGNGRIDTTPLLQMFQGLTVGSLLVQLVATPLIAVVGMYLTAAVFHLLLLAVRGAPRGFDATLTVVGYASGVFLLRALPACGGLVAGVWFMVLAIHGLAEAQRCGTGKSAFAVLMPIVLACVFACVAGTIAGIAGLGSLRGGGSPSSTGI